MRARAKLLQLGDDPRFTTGLERGKNQKELIAIIEGWMQKFATDEEVVEALDQQRVPCAPVMSIVDTLAHPYFKAREMVRQVPDPVFGELTIPGFPFKYSEFPKLLNIQAPLLGEHNAEVLRKQLGYSETQVNTLRAQGILFADNT